MHAWLVVSKGQVFLFKGMKNFYKRQAVMFDEILWGVRSLCGHKSKRAALPVGSCRTGENGPCTSPGQRSRAVLGGVGKLALRM